MPSTGTLINPDVTNAVLPPSPIVRFLKSVAAVAISTVPLDVFGTTMLPTALQAATSAGLRVTCTLSEPGAGVTVRQLLSSSVERIRKRSEEHTSELQSQSNLVCRLLLEKKHKHYW